MNLLHQKINFKVSFFTNNQKQEAKKEDMHKLIYILLSLLVLNISVLAKSPDSLTYKPAQTDTTAPVVVISTPTQNQSLIAGQTVEVKWQSTDNIAVASQSLLLSLDGGKTFATVSEFGATDNSFTIGSIEELNITNSKGIVRVIATDSSGNLGQASINFVIAPAIVTATYQSKVLTLLGIGFISNASNSTTKLFINNKEIKLTPITLFNTTFRLKANKKKLSLLRGDNTVRLVVDGISSNSFSFTF